MKTGMQMVAPFIVIAALGVSACATNQVDRKQVTEQKARDVSGDIWAADNQIDATLVSLDNLMSADGPQLQQAFDQYSKEVDLMRTRAKQVNDDATAVSKQSGTYLNNWQQQNNNIENEDLRDNSQEQRQTVMARFQNLQNSNDQSRSALNQFLRKLEDVRTALRNDLTARGITSVAQSSTVEDAQDAGSEAKTRLQQVRSDSIALADTLSPSATAPSADEATANR
jgi:hypothetical protein